MSPFDIFVITVFVIATVKACVDAVDFWKESEELAAMHFRAVDARIANKKKIHASTKPSNMNPKHLPPPCRPSHMPRKKPCTISTELRKTKTVSRKPLTAA